MKKFLYALRFMTIIPLPYKQDENMTDVARSLALFPLIGGLIGLLLWATGLLSGLLFSSLTTGFVVMIVSMIITGGLHLDGLSDLADGLGGSRNRERRLEIMKDSRIGAFGALTLIGFLLLKGLFMGELIGGGQVLWLILPPLWARFFGVLVIKTFPTARPDGMGDFFQKNARPVDLVVAALLALTITWAVTLPSLPWEIPFLLLLVYLFLVVFVMMIPAMIINKILNGLTGDCYGALIEGTELASLLSLIILMGQR
jgi:adenosylcobinamide-GDP ribazoletransferase